MKIYVDFDDCICETARAFPKITERLFGKSVPYEQIRFFNLQDSFGLTDEEYKTLMIEAHKPEVLGAYEEAPGASSVLNEWMDLGHEVCIITGRPYSTCDVSHAWLEEHGLGRLKLYFLNKYGRDSFYEGSAYNLELEEYYKMKFDYAIEDSPMAFEFFNHLPDLKVLVYNRPWNVECDLPGENYFRCPDWDHIRKIVKSK